MQPTGGRAGWGCVERTVMMDHQNDDSIPKEPTNMLNKKLDKLTFDYRWWLLTRLNTHGHLRDFPGLPLTLFLPEFQI